MSESETLLKAGAALFRRVLVVCRRLVGGYLMRHLCARAAVIATRKAQVRT